MSDTNPKLLYRHIVNMDGVNMIVYTSDPNYEPKSNNNSEH